MIGASSIQLLIVVKKEEIIPTVAAVVKVQIKEQVKVSRQDNRRSQRVIARCQR